MNPQVILEKLSPGTVDTAIGVTAGAGGSTGVAYQMFQEAISVATLGVNFAIAVAGLYLIYLRIKRLKQKKTDGK